MSRENVEVVRRIYAALDQGDEDNLLPRLARDCLRGKASSVDVSARVWNVWTFRDGKPVEWTYFGDDREAAFAAAGLRPGY